MAEPILNLHANLNTPGITFNGTVYPLRSQMMGSIVWLTELRILGQRLAELETLFTKGENTVEQAKEQSSKLDAMCRKVLDAPDEVHQALDDGQRNRICESFLRFHGLIEPAPVEQTMVPAAVSTRSPSKTGARSRRSSRASMAAVPGIG